VAARRDGRVKGAGAYQSRARIRALSAWLDMPHAKSRCGELIGIWCWRRPPLQRVPRPAGGRLRLGRPTPWRWMLDGMKPDTNRIAVIGGGPAGLIAAERLSKAGLAVDVFDAMPSVGRKLLMAGRGGLNLTHSEPLDRFVTRYGPAAALFANLLARFTPADLREWCGGLGVPTFVGSSGRVFPESFKASLLLRAWLRRLDAQGVRFHLRHRWLGWSAEGDLIFGTGGERIAVARPAAVILALGGASWPRLGSDGAWADILRARGVEVTPFRPSNSGFDVPWSPGFQERAEGQPLKRLAVTFAGRTVRGELVVTRTGLEGGAIYALSSLLRATIEQSGRALVSLDLKPDLTEGELRDRLSRVAAGESLANRLRKGAGLPPPVGALLREFRTPQELAHPASLAAGLKALPVPLTGVRGLDRAISSAGGIRLDELDEKLMLRRMPGVFAAGEMLDWEAPTGGYLLQGCFASGVVAAEGVKSWFRHVPA